MLFFIFQEERKCKKSQCRNFKIVKRKKLSRRARDKIRVDKAFYDRWSKWSLCSDKCKTSRFKACRFATVCGLSKIYEEAYCYAKGKNTICKSKVFYIRSLHLENFDTKFFFKSRNLLFCLFLGHFSLVSVRVRSPRLTSNKLIYTTTLCGKLTNQNIKNNTIVLIFYTFQARNVKNGTKRANHSEIFQGLAKKRAHFLMISLMMTKAFRTNQK